MERLAIIPARAGSKGIPKKNIVDFMGKPLIAHTIEALLESKSFDRVIVSTDGEEIAEVALKYGAEVPFMRPSDLASDDAGALGVIKHALSFYDHKEWPHTIGYFQPTSPLRSAENIKEALVLFETSQADSLVSVVRTPHNMSPESVMKMGEGNQLADYLENEDKTLQRQLKTTFYARNGAAIYLLKTSLLSTLSKKIWGGITVGYEMNKFQSIDIDEWDDLKIAQCYASLKL